MQLECSCGDSCPICDKCDNPQCECYCDLDDDIKPEKEDNENEDEVDW